MNIQPNKSQRYSYAFSSWLYYNLNKRLALGVRAEWLRYRDTYVQYEDISDDHQISLTFGLNWKPTGFLTFRPEVRYDKFSHYAPFNKYTHTKDPYGRPTDEANPKKSQWSYGISAVVEF